MTWLIDGHEDLAWNALSLGRDETLPLAEIRRREGAQPAHGEGTATVSLPSLRATDVRVVLATVFTYPQRAGGDGKGYRTPEEAFAQAGAQLDYYHRLHQEGQVALINTRGALEQAIRRQTPMPGLLLLMENADPIRRPHDLATFVARGVRIVGLAWKSTRYAGGTGEPGPLTEDGRALLREMDRLGVALDVSHLAEEAFWQALEVFHGPVIASHADCRAITPGDRQLSDEMIRAIAARDGVIGLVLYNRFLRPGWTPAMGKDAVTFADVLAHAQHIAALVGIRHVAIGSDLDGGVGRETVPREIDSVEDLPKFADVLAAVGYDREAQTGVLAENWLRVLRRILPEEPAT